MYETKKKPKSTLLADNTRWLITTKQTKPRQVASSAPHPITRETKEIFKSGIAKILCRGGGGGGGDWIAEEKGLSARKNLPKQVYSPPPPTESMRSMRSVWSRIMRLFLCSAPAFWGSKRGCMRAPGRGGKKTSPETIQHESVVLTKDFNSCQWDILIERA